MHIIIYTDSMAALGKLLTNCTNSSFISQMDHYSQAPCLGSSMLISTTGRKFTCFKLKSKTILDLIGTYNNRGRFRHHQLVIFQLTVTRNGLCKKSIQYPIKKLTSIGKQHRDDNNNNFYTELLQS